LNIFASFCKVTVIFCHFQAKKINREYFSGSDIKDHQVTLVKNSPS